MIGRQADGDAHFEFDKLAAFFPLFACVNNVAYEQRRLL